MAVSEQQIQSTSPDNQAGRGLLWIAVVGVLLCGAAWTGSRCFLHRLPVNRQITLGEAALAAGDGAGAERDWRKAIALDPRRPEAYHLLGEYYAANGMPEKAIPLFERLRVIAPNTPHTLCRLAEAYALSGDNVHALTVAREAVIVEPTCPRAHAVLGIEMSDRLEHPGAIAELQKAHRLAPNNDRITLSLAQAQLNAADLTAAAATIEPVTRHAPKNIDAFYLLGWCYARGAPTPANHNRALRALQRVLQLAPKNVSAMTELGRVEEASHDLVPARHYLEHAWRSGPHDPEVGKLLLSVYQQMGDHAAAGRLMAEIQRQRSLAARANSLQSRLVADKTDTAAAIELAEVKAEQGDLADAGGLITAVLNSGRRDPTALEAAARIYRLAGLTQQAAALARTASAPRGARGVVIRGSNGVKTALPTP